MKIKILSVLFCFLILLNWSGVYASEIIVTDMDENKSFDGIGLMKTNQKNMYAVCVEHDVKFTLGQQISTTDGTSQIKQNNPVKQLIVNNYRENMSKEEGAALQEAIWYFTDKRETDNVLAKKMISNVNESLIIEDETKVLISNKSEFKEKQSSNEIKLVDRINKSSVNETLISTIVKTSEEIINNQIIKTTTKVKTFLKETETDIIELYENKTITKEIYEVTEKYLNFKFSSYLDPLKQNMILFETSTDENKYNSYKESTETTNYSKNKKENKSETYQTTEITKEFKNITTNENESKPINNDNNTNNDKNKKINLNKTTKNKKSSIDNGISMKSTGLPVIFLALLVLLMSTVIYRRK